MRGSRLKFGVRSAHFTSSHASSSCAHVVCLILHDFSPFLFLLSIFCPIVLFFPPGHQLLLPRCGGQIPCALLLMRTLAPLPSTTLSQKPWHKQMLCRWSVRSEGRYSKSIGKIWRCPRSGWRGNLGSALGQRNTGRGEGRTLILRREQAYFFFDIESVRLGEEYCWEQLVEFSHNFNGGRRNNRCESSTGGQEVVDSFQFWWPDPKRAEKDHCVFFVGWWVFFSVDVPDVSGRTEASPSCCVHRTELCVSWVLWSKSCG